jgi:hypothetical protein
MLSQALIWSSAMSCHASTTAMYDSIFGSASCSYDEKLLVAKQDLRELLALAQK